MRKIRTIFERDWKGNRKVIDKATEGLLLNDLQKAVATEKIDGTNIRLTMRSGEVVRIEKRRNPSKLQKQQGIIEPWYVDVQEDSTGDKWILEAVQSTDLSAMPDGEWSAEAYGEKIQGNPLKINGHRVFVFSLPSEKEKITFQNVPTDYNKLAIWLASQKSILGNDTSIEGLVWHFPDGRMFKIKRKDFPAMEPSQIKA